MQKELLTATEAYEGAAQSSGFNEVATTFVCPYPECRSFAHHLWAVINHANVVVQASYRSQRPLDGVNLRVAKCVACDREVVWLDGKMVRPHPSDAPMRAPDMPDTIWTEYDEAAAIINESPRGAAALLRLAVQKLLPVLGATKRDINDQIGELVGSGIITRQVSDAFDVLRVIGNEAVHPGTIDLNDDRATAMSLFRVLNYIVEKAITEPRLAAELFSKLPANKREGIEARNARAIAETRTTGD